MARRAVWLNDKGWGLKWFTSIPQGIWALPRHLFPSAPAPHFLQSLVPSRHCLFQYLLLFSFSPFPFTINAEWRNNGLNPMAENNLTTQISLSLHLFHWKNAVESFVGNISEKLWKGEVWSKRPTAFPCAPQHEHIHPSQLPQDVGQLWAQSRITPHFMASGLTQTPKNLPKETWHNTQPPWANAPSYRQHVQLFLKRRHRFVWTPRDVLSSTTSLPCPSRQFIALSNTLFVLFQPQNC